uniref:AraC family transcriptional regulator n=1 Tax=Caenorhabditis tropicalis TaxID=1561998 RepID=A0A1I7T6M2_9PELO
MKEFSVSQVPIRKKTLARINDHQEFHLLYGSLAPEVFCPEKCVSGRLETVENGFAIRGKRQETRCE